MASTQANRLLSLTTPLPYDQLLITRLRASEGISQLFRYELEIVHEHGEAGNEPFYVDPTKLIGQPMSVRARQVAGDGEIERHFNGICVRFSQGNRNTLFTSYNAEVVPRVWLLTQIRQSRIFQNKSVSDILREVLQGFEVSWEIQETHEPRNYCVQYRESDWDFASRLMEEEGIFYFFEHREEGHKLIVADTPQAHKDLQSKNKIPFEMVRASITEQWVGSILSWHVDDKVKTGKTTLWDHNFELVGKRLEATEPSRFNIGQNTKLESYDYPGGYAKTFDGIDRGGGEQSGVLNKVFQDNKRTAKIRQQELDVAYKNSFGISDCCSLTPGYKFELTEHPVSTYNGKHVIVSLNTAATQSPAYISDEMVSNCYTASFVCISHGKSDSPPFRPNRTTPTPTVQGTQTAVVVGPAGEEIFTDKYGRVKVQFHWDREGHQDEGSSCWVRVAQTWAGNKWGTMFIPRIGMEVLVDFLEGDPDRPIIVGCVYNPENMPPYTLPDEKTKSTIKSNSSKGGSGFNEIRFEDKKGSEQIFIHAEKDKDIRVKNDLKETINHDRHLIVDNDQYEKVKKDKHLDVTGNQTEKFGGSVAQNIGGSHDVKIAQKYAADAGTEIHLKAGMNTTIEAGASLTLKVGGNFVNINPGGVFIKGTMVMINSGGAAGSGSGASPGSPTAAKEADKAETGKAAKVPSPPPAKQPAQFAALASLVREKAVNPGAMSVQQAAAGMAAAVANEARNASQAAQATMAGAAAAAMAAAQSMADEVKQKADDLADKAKDKLDEAKALAEDLKDKAEEMADKALAAAQEAKDKAPELADKAKEAVTEAQQAAQEKLDEAKQAVEDAKQAAQEKVEEAKAAVEEAKQQAQAAAEEAKEQAEQAVNEAKEKLNEAQQQAQQAVDDAKQQVEEAKQEVEKAAEEAKQQAEKAVEEGKQQAEQVVNEAKDQAEQAVDKATEAATDAAKQAEEAATQAAEEAKQAAEQLTEEAGKALQGAQDAIPFM